MPTYEHKCSACEHEWEDIYSMRDPVPTVCPNCKVEGQVKRLISVPGKGNVELTGRDLTTKLWNEGKDLARKARTDYKLAENLYGRK
jgi:putative FmdB family regulatory protein